MTTKLVLGKDINGNVTFVLPFSDTGYATTLAPGVVQNLTVPPNCNTAIFSYSSGADVWVNPTTTAAVPGGAFAATLADQNPVGRLVTAGSTLSFISASACEIKVSFYQMSANYTGVS